MEQKWLFVLIHCVAKWPLYTAVIHTSEDVYDTLCWSYSASGVWQAQAFVRQG